MISPSYKTCWLLLNTYISYVWKWIIGLFAPSLSQGLWWGLPVSSSQILLLAPPGERSHFWSLPVLSNLPQQPWVFKDCQDWPDHDASQLPQHLCLHPVRSHGCPACFKCSLTCYPCTNGKALVQAFPLVSGSWDSWRCPEGKDWGKGSPGYLGLFHLYHHHSPCWWVKFTQSLRPLLGWAFKWEE